MLAVGGSTLPLYRDFPGEDLVWSSKRILPVDELLPEPRDAGATFVARLRGSLPPSLAARTEPIRPTFGDDLSAGICACVLGLGPDGHIAFNQPGTGPDEATRVVELTEENLARLGDVAPSTHARTIGVAEILRADRVLLIASGPGKQQALARVLDGPEGSDMPASWLRRHPALTVLVDEETVC